MVHVDHMCKCMYGRSVKRLIQLLTRSEGGRQGGRALSSSLSSVPPSSPASFLPPLLPLLLPDTLPSSIMKLSGGAVRHKQHLPAPSPCTVPLHSASKISERHVVAPAQALSC